jgi:hypothetical protein
MKYITKIEYLASALIKVDNAGPDCKITVSEFERIKSEKELLHSLSGVEKSMTWEDFKISFRNYQSSEFNFDWNKGKGHSGTLILDKVTLPMQIGEEIAKKLMQENRQDGYLNEVIEEFLPKLYDYFDKCKFDKKNIDLTLVKEALTSTSNNKNERYKFITRSNKFQLGVAQYSFRTGNDKAEFELGKIIEDSLKRILQLENIYHKQEERKHRKYQNVDFEGYRVIKKLSGDEIEVVNIELKPSNKIESVSDAISQSINYKEKAQKTYIAIPLFDPRNFYDTSRFYNFVKLCEENEVGIISINMEPESHKFNGLDIVIEAPKREIQNYEVVKELLQIDKREYCILCRKIVKADDERLKDCGWSFNDNEQSICMKTVFENVLVKK